MAEPPLTFEQAKPLALRLATIDDFPRYDEAIDATADDLVRWCKGGTFEGREWIPIAQARWLVDEARHRWDKWPGTFHLLALFRTKFDTTPPPSNAAQELGPVPLPACGKCNDSGTVKGPAGRHVFCNCDQGRKMQEPVLFDGEMKPGLGDGWLRYLDRTAGIPDEPAPKRDEVAEARLELAQHTPSERSVIENAIAVNRAIAADSSAPKDQRRAAKRFLKFYDREDAA